MRSVDGTAHVGTPTALDGAPLIEAEARRARVDEPWVVARLEFCDLLEG